MFQVNHGSSGSVACKKQTDFRSITRSHMKAANTWPYGNLIHLITLTATNYHQHVSSFDLNNQFSWKKRTKASSAAASLLKFENKKLKLNTQIKEPENNVDSILCNAQLNLATLKESSSQTKVETHPHSRRGSRAGWGSRGARSRSLLWRKGAPSWRSWELRWSKASRGCPWRRRLNGKSAAALTPAGE